MREGSMQTEMALTERDLLRVQAANPDCRVELRDGKIIVMSPSGLFSEAVGTRLLARLHQFVEEHRLGLVVGSSGGFHLPNGDIVGPDVAFVSRERLRSVPRGFARVAPDLAVEVKSPSNRIPELAEKLAMLRSQGTTVTLLIDPDERTVVFEGAGGQRRVLRDEDTIELSSLLPGWSMRVSELWPESL